MAYRKRVNRKKSRRTFRKGAKRVNRRNYRTGSMRGGIRL